MQSCHNDDKIKQWGERTHGLIFCLLWLSVVLSPTLPVVSHECLQRTLGKNEALLG